MSTPSSSSLSSVTLANIPPPTPPPPPGGIQNNNMSSGSSRKRTLPLDSSLPPALQAQMFASAGNKSKQVKRNTSSAVISSSNSASSTSSSLNVTSSATLSTSSSKLHTNTTPPSSPFSSPTLSPMSLNTLAVFRLPSPSPSQLISATAASRSASFSSSSTAISSPSIIRVTPPIVLSSSSQSTLDRFHNLLKIHLENANITLPTKLDDNTSIPTYFPIDLVEEIKKILLTLNKRGATLASTNTSSTLQSLVILYQLSISYPLLYSHPVFLPPFLSLLTNYSTPSLSSTNSNAGVKKFTSSSSNVHTISSNAMFAFIVFLVQHSYSNISLWPVEFIHTLLKDCVDGHSWDEVLSDTNNTNTNSTSNSSTIIAGNTDPQVELFIKNLLTGLKDEDTVKKNNIVSMDVNDTLSSGIVDHYSSHLTALRAHVFNLISQVLSSIAQSELTTTATKTAFSPSNLSLIHFCYLCLSYRAIRFISMYLCEVWLDRSDTRSATHKLLIKLQEETEHYYLTPVTSDLSLILLRPILSSFTPSVDFFHPESLQRYTEVRHIDLHTFIHLLRMPVTDGTEQEWKEKVVKSYVMSAKVFGRIGLEFVLTLDESSPGRGEQNQLLNVILDGMNEAKDNSNSSTDSSNKFSSSFAPSVVATYILSSILQSLTNTVTEPIKLFTLLLRCCNTQFSFLSFNHYLLLLAPSSPHSLLAKSTNSLRNSILSLLASLHLFASLLAAVVFCRSNPLLASSSSDKYEVLLCEWRFAMAENQKSAIQFISHYVTDGNSIKLEPSNVSSLLKYFLSAFPSADSFIDSIPLHSLLTSTSASVQSNLDLSVCQSAASLCIHSLPLEEETLSTLIYLSLSSPPLLLTSESLSLIEQLVNRAIECLLSTSAVLYNNALNITNPQLIEAIYKLTYSTDNGKVVTELFWRATTILIILIACQPSHLADIAYNQYPTLMAAIKAFVTQSFTKFPPIPSIEHDTKPNIPDDNMADDLPNNLDISPRSTLAICDSTILSYWQVLDKRFHIGKMLRSSREPDLFHTILMKQSTQTRLSWLLPLCLSETGLLQRLPNSIKFNLLKTTIENFSFNFCFDLNPPLNKTHNSWRLQFAYRYLPSSCSALLLQNEQKQHSIISTSSTPSNRSEFLAILPHLNTLLTQLRHTLKKDLHISKESELYELLYPVFKSLAVTNENKRESAALLLHQLFCSPPANSSVNSSTLVSSCQLSGRCICWLESFSSFSFSFPQPDTVEQLKSTSIPGLFITTVSEALQSETDIECLTGYLKTFADKWITVRATTSVSQLFIALAISRFLVSRPLTHLSIIKTAVGYDSISIIFNATLNVLNTPLTLQQFDLMLMFLFNLTRDNEEKRNHYNSSFLIETSNDPTIVKFERIWLKNDNSHSELQIPKLLLNGISIFLARPPVLPSFIISPRSTHEEQQKQQELYRITQQYNSIKNFFFPPSDSAAGTVSRISQIQPSDNPTTASYPTSSTCNAILLYSTNSIAKTSRTEILEYANLIKYGKMHYRSLERFISSSYVNAFQLIVLLYCIAASIIYSPNVSNNDRLEARANFYVGEESNLETTVTEPISLINSEADKTPYLFSLMSRGAVNDQIRTLLKQRQPICGL